MTYNDLLDTMKEMVPSLKAEKAKFPLLDNRCKACFFFCNFLLANTHTQYYSLNIIII